MTSCSVIIAGYDTGRLIFAAIKSALKQSNLAEVILVDHGNPPDILARLQQIALSEPKLKIIASMGEDTLGRVYNLGAKQATGGYLAFMRPDCLLSPEALTECIRALENTRGAMLAGCAVLNPDGSEQRISNDILPLPQVQEVHALSPVFLVTKATDYKFFGGFDDGYIFSGTVRDLFKIVRKAHRKIVLVPGVNVTQIHDYERDAIAPTSTWSDLRDTMRYYNKHYNGRYFPGDILFIRLGLVLRHIVLSPVRKWRQPKPDERKTVEYRRLMVLASGLAQFPESKQFYGKTIFVTGATSEIGLCVVRRLMAAGASVLALSRGDAIAFEHAQLRWIKDDLDNPNCSLHGYYADMVVHCAPLAFLPAAIAMLKEAGVTRIIAFSSALVSAKLLTKDQQEKAYLESLAKCEKTIENAAKDSNIEWTILRPSMVYGVGLDKGITWLYRLIRRWGFMSIYPPALGRCQPVHADDLAIAVVQAMDTKESFGKSYNLSGAEILTYREMLERLFALCHKPVRLFSWSLLPYFLDMAGRILGNRRINAELAYRMNEHMLFFHDAARNDFGFQPRTFLSGGIHDMEGV